METDSHEHDSALYSQLEDSYGKINYSYTTQVIKASGLKKQDNILKWLQMILSALSTGGFISSLITNNTVSVWVSGLCSTMLLVLTAYFKDNNLSFTYQKHLDTSNKLWLIREQYLSLLTDFDTLSREEVTERRNTLQEKAAKIYEEAPLTDDKSYSLAQKALKNNESQFFSREELNLMLPENLRK